jgi:hypothetical protein
MDEETRGILRQLAEKMEQLIQIIRRIEHQLSEMERRQAALEKRYER